MARGYQQRRGPVPRLLGEVTTRFGADGFSEVVSEGQAIESTFFGVLVVIPATLFVSKPTTDEWCSLR